MKNKSRFIYIIFSHSGTIPSKIIKTFTRHEYSHVSISLDENPNEFYSFARKKFNPFIAGFVIEGVNKGIFSKFVNTKCRVYKLEVTKKRYDRLKKVIEKFVKHKEKYKYNYLGLISPVIHLPIRVNKTRYFCSQFVATALEESKVVNIPKNPICISPKQLCMYIQQCKYSTCIYEGKLREYSLKLI